MKKTITCLTILFAVMISTSLLPAYLANAQTQQPTVSMDPTSIAATQIDQSYTLNITIANVQNLWGWAVNITWDSQYLKYQGAQEGDFLSNINTTQFLPPIVENFTDEYHNSDTFKAVRLADAINGADTTGMENSASGSGLLATITFEVIQQTQSTPITLSVENLEGPVNTATGQSAGSNPLITPASYTTTTLASLIIPGPPTANAGKEQTVLQGAQVIFNASQSVSTGTNTNYTWTFTDGTQQTLTGMIANYTFNNVGNYSVTLTVQDSLGSSNSTVIIHVLTNPDITATPTPGPTSTSNGASTPTPTTTPTTTSTIDPNSTPTQNTASFNLPPTILGILIVLTVFVFGGSIQWLRKRT